MATNVAGKSLRGIYAGTKVERATANLPASTNGNLFQVTGGRVLLSAIVGEVTTAIQAQANATQLNHQSAVIGGVGTPICATVDISAAPVGTQFGLSGGFGTAATIGAAVPTPAPIGIVLTAGFLRLNTAATSTGQMRWTVTYVPLDDGAAMVAV